MKKSPKATEGERRWLLDPGMMVDHFRIMRPLGHGGMGEIFLARDTRLGRKVALKLIRPGVLGSRQATERFLFEARATAQFNHPHIVTIHTVGEDHGQPYVALEYLEGQSLRERISQQRPGEREALRFGLEIASALEEAQRHGILHRDLKPENVMLARDGRLRVLDFGMAKVLQQPRPAELDAGSELDARVERATNPISLDDTIADPGAPQDTEHQVRDTITLQGGAGPAAVELPEQSDPPAGATGGSAAPILSSTLAPLESGGRGLAGTPAYMAPEQWKESSKVTGAADIWALGMILYEMAAGRRPYEARVPLQLALRVCESVPVPPVERHGDVSPGLAGLIGDCLQKDPEQRPGASEVAQRLQQLLERGAGPGASQECPFRGLLPFDEQHSQSFFGRDLEIASITERLRLEPVLPVVGPSGAGKSSFVKAGVIPRLRERGPLEVLQLRPGRKPFETEARIIQGARRRPTASHAPSPFGVQVGAPPGQQEGPAGAKEAPQDTVGAGAESLAAQLQETPQQLNLVLHRLSEQRHSNVLLAVDQLEELYTLVPSAELRRRFMQALCAAADDPQAPVRVIFTLREEFLSRLVEGPGVREALSHITVLQSPGSEALLETLTRPLELAGYRFEDQRMVQEMLAEVEGERSCLPLLQFAGQVLWDRRDRKARMLRRSDYREMGGVAGALARHADGVLAGMSAEELTLTRTIFLRLVTPERTRRVLGRSQVLEGLGEAAARVLMRLIEARLISTRQSAEGAAELELVHESLVATWSRLRRWIEESHEELRLLAEVEQAAELWNKRGRREQEVWRGEALREAQRILGRSTSDLPSMVARFLEAGGARARRAGRRRRIRLVAVMALLGLLAVGATIVALTMSHQKREADDQRSRAERMRKTAEQRHAESLVEGARAALLQGDRLEARAKLRGSLEARDSMLARGLWWRLTRDPRIWSRNFGGVVVSVDISPDGKLLAVNSGNTVTIVDSRTRATRRILRGHQREVITLAFSPDGRHLASADAGGGLLLWQVKGWRKQLTLAGHPRRIRIVAFSPGGELLASGGLDRSVRLWEVKTGTLRRTADGQDRGQRGQLQPPWRAPGHRG